MKTTGKPVSPPASRASREIAAMPSPTCSRSSARFSETRLTRVAHGSVSATRYPETSSEVKSPITCSMSGWTAGRSKTVTVTETPSCPLKIRKVSQKLANTSAEGVT